MQIERLDLHGYTVRDAMRRFVQAYNRLLARGPGWALEVVHGKGTVDAGSLIRSSLRSYLKSQGTRIEKYNARLLLMGAEYLLEGCGRLAYMHGEDATKNAGVTIVVPLGRIALPREYL